MIQKVDDDDEADQMDDVLGPEDGEVDEDDIAGLGFSFKGFFPALFISISFDQFILVLLVANSFSFFIKNN